MTRNNGIHFFSPVLLACVFLSIYFSMVLIFDGFVPLGYMIFDLSFREFMLFALVTFSRSLESGSKEISELVSWQVNFNERLRQ